MAQEIQFYGNPTTQSGLTITVDIFNTNGVEVTSSLNVPEVGTSAIYITDMPMLPEDNYVIRFFDGTSYLVAGSINWDGEKEVDYLERLHKFAGLDKNNPLIVTQDSMIVDDIEVTITGDCETITTMTSN